MVYSCVLLLKFNIRKLNDKSLIFNQATVGDTFLTPILVSEFVKPIIRISNMQPFKNMFDFLKSALRGSATPICPYKIWGNELQ